MLDGVPAVWPPWPAMNGEVPIPCARKMVAIETKAIAMKNVRASGAVRAANMIARASISAIAEAALTIREKKIGWVVTPDRPNELADTIRIASGSIDASMAQRAVGAARDFSPERAMLAYVRLMDELLQGGSRPKGQPS